MKIIRAGSSGIGHRILEPEGGSLGPTPLACRMFDCSATFIASEKMAD